MLVQRKPDPHYTISAAILFTQNENSISCKNQCRQLPAYILNDNTGKKIVYLLGSIVYVKFEFQFTVSLRILGLYFVNSRVFPSCQANVKTSPGNGHYAGIKEGLTGFRDAISGLEPLVLNVGRVGCGRQFDQQVAAFINCEHFAIVFGKVGLICKIKTKLVGIRDLPEVLI